MLKNHVRNANYIEQYYSQINFNDIFQINNTRHNTLNKIETESKTIRKKLMDKVKEFVDYAYYAGSKNCAMYYISFSNLVKNRDLRIVYPIIYEKIDTGIKNKLNYKEIYKNCSKEIRGIRKNSIILREV